VLPNFGRFPATHVQSLHEYEEKSHKDYLAIAVALTAYDRSWIARCNRCSAFNASTRFAPILSGGKAGGGLTQINAEAPAAA
jgi:hypothetical protein